MSAEKLGRFDPVKIIWDGNEYEVEPDRVWGLVKVVEGHISFTKLAQRLNDKDVPELVIAEAYCDALRYAGCRKVTPFELQMETSGPDRYAHSYVLLSILMLTQPDFKKKLQSKPKPQPKTAPKKKPPARKKAS